MIKAGDVLFFKKAKRSSARRAPEMAFQGYGFGVFLGHVPPFAPDPPKQYLARIMGEAGYISFDDIIEFLGQESFHQCFKKFDDKYIQPLLEAAKKAEEEKKPNPLLVPKPKQLVGPDGKPLE